MVLLQVRGRGSESGRPSGPPRRRRPRRSGPARRSARSSWPGSGTSSRKTSTWPSSADRRSPRSSASTRRRSRSGSRTSAPRSRRPAARRTPSRSSSWPRASTTTRRCRSPRRSSSRPPSCRPSRPNSSRFHVNSPARANFIIFESPAPSRAANGLLRPEVHFTSSRSFRFYLRVGLISIPLRKEWYQIRNYRRIDDYSFIRDVTSNFENNCKKNLYITSAISLIIVL